MKSRHAASFALATFAAVGLAVLAACSANPMPGTLIGTYKVTAQSQTNTCGLTAPNPWAFDVQLSQKDTTLYWSWMDGSPLLSGATASSQASLTSVLELNVDGTDASAGPCTMMRSDTIDVALASGAAPASFTGSINYAIEAAPGATCTDQLTNAGGQYAVLPCTITYSMTAARQ
jgi:hypothetical protein